MCDYWLIHTRQVGRARKKDEKKVLTNEGECGILYKRSRERGIAEAKTCNRGSGLEGKNEAKESKVRTFLRPMRK